MKNVKQPAIHVLVGAIAWAAVLFAAQAAGVYRTEEHHTDFALEWLDSVSSTGETAILLLGSSNVAYSLDCERLDSICAQRRETWYNLGQRGMADFELVDYALQLIHEIDSGQVGGVYLELNARPITDYRPDWRRASILHPRSIWAISKQHIVLAKTWSQRWEGFENGLQSILMKAVAPVHNWLHPPDFTDLTATKGFHPPPDNRTWHPRSARDTSLIEARINRETQYRDFLTSRTTAHEKGDDHRVFPLEGWSRLKECCDQKGIVLAALCIPTERTEQAFNAMDSILGRTPFVLGLDGNERPFSTPKYLRDPRHLSREGARLVSDQFARKHMEHFH